MDNRFFQLYLRSVLQLNGVDLNTIDAGDYSSVVALIRNRMTFTEWYEGVIALESARLELEAPTEIIPEEPKLTLQNDRKGIAEHNKSSLLWVKSCTGLKTQFKDEVEEAKVA